MPLKSRKGLNLTLRGSLLSSYILPLRESSIQIDEVHNLFSPISFSLNDLKCWDDHVFGDDRWLKSVTHQIKLVFVFYREYDLKN